jgi:hypothetical protein
MSVLESAFQFRSFAEQGAASEKDVLLPLLWTLQPFSRAHAGRQAGINYTLCAARKERGVQQREERERKVHAAARNSRH